jgi:integrase
MTFYINPHAGDVRVDQFTLEHADFVMSNLPEKSRKTGRPLTSATRRQVAQVMGRLLNLAVYPGRWRKESPIPKGWLPKPGPSKAKECLYPDEDAKLLDGKATHPGKADVPLLRRFAYGFLSREGMRTDEMASLRWRDVDLERGRVTLDKNKTDDPRDWELRPDVVEALGRWKKRYQPKAEAGDHVFAEDGVPINVERLAEQLRADLERVGVDRPQLFERSEARQPLRAHDLRATFITVALATGQTETWVMDRTGHTTSEMVNRYRRKARSWKLGQLGPLHLMYP